MRTPKRQTFPTCRLLVKKRRTPDQTPNAVTFQETLILGGADKKGDETSTHQRKCQVANPSALYRGQKPQIEKRGFRSQKPHFSPPQKRAFRVKKSHFPCGALERKGDVLTRNVLDSETLLPRFGVFDPCAGRTDSQV